MKNIDKIIDIIENGSSYDLYFSRKLRMGYESFSPNVDKQIFEELSGLILNNIKKYKDLEQIEYNPTGYRENTLEKCEIKYVEKNYERILESFKIADTVATEIDPDNFSFYCFSVRNENNEEVKFYRRVTKFKKLSSKGILAKMIGNRLNKIENKLIGIDGELDLVEYNEEILILSHYSLERIFDLQDKFLENARIFLEKMNQKPLIENFEKFKEDCLNDGRFTKTLTKMSNENIELEILHEKVENIKKTIDMFELEIKISKDEDKPKIIYEEKNQINDILRILRDCYYISLINEKKGVDNKI